MEKKQRIIVTVFFLYTTNIKQQKNNTMAAKDIERHKFPKGKSGNPNGRPRKYVSLLKEQGYKRSEIDDCIRAMLSMDLSELKDVFDNDKATILEKTIAKAMVKSLEKGTLYSIETLLSRTYGQPKQEIEQTVIEKPIFTGIDLSVKSNSNPTEEKSKED